MLERTGLALIFVFGLPLILPAIGVAQSHAPSPYQGQETREIKSFSPADIRALTNGEGMGLAKPAELNRYPGPSHVLQLADALELSDGQRVAVQAIFDRMQRSAVTTGQRILALERDLDRAFAERAIDTASLQRQVAVIARLQGQLRAIHLRAHLETLPLLSGHQAHQYQVLRGYDAAPGGEPAHGYPQGSMPRH